MCNVPNLQTTTSTSNATAGSASADPPPSYSDVNSTLVKKYSDKDFSETCGNNDDVDCELEEEEVLPTYADAVS